MNKIIEVNHLQKSYGNVEAVKDISFYVESGKLFAFLGPNGAGKSTTINSICTFLKPDAGEVIVNGHFLGKQDDEIRKDIGTVFQEGLLDPLLTIEENLMLRGSFYGLRDKKLRDAVKKAAVCSEVVELLYRPYGKLSGGQKRRCDIARALIHTPKILFLDEPTTGLDPQTRKSIWTTVRRLQQEEGMTVFLTTHYMEEAEDADYVIVVDNGRIAAGGTPLELKEKYANDFLQIKCKDEDKFIDGLKNWKLPYRRAAQYIEVTLKNTLEALPILSSCESNIEDFTVVKGSMDDVFLEITGKEIRE